jgi:hypothetical protein
VTWAIFKTLDEHLVDRNKIKVPSLEDYHRIQAQIVSDTLQNGIHAEEDLRLRKVIEK